MVKMNNWIKVTDRLPELNVRVLILCGQYIEIDKYSVLKDGNIWSCTAKEVVSHWMPLPPIEINGEDEGYTCSIPTYGPTFEEVSKQMRINCDILKKEFSDHVDKEIARFIEVKDYDEEKQEMKLCIKEIIGQDE